MLRKYPLEILLILAASFGTIGFAIWSNQSLIKWWWSANWWWIVILTILLTSKVWWPVAREISSAPWRAFTAVVDYVHGWIDRNEGRMLLASVRTRIDEGHDTEYSNAVTGISFKVGDPYAKPGMTVIEEEDEEDVKLLDSPIPQAPPFIQMSHLISNKQLVLCYTTEGPAFGTVKDLLSMIITGKPGRGKTTALIYYVTILLKNGAEVFVWDPHGTMNELSILNDRLLPGMPATSRVTYLDRKEDIIGSVPVLQAKLAERDELYRDGHQTKHPLLLLADELPVLADYDAWIVAQYKAKNKKRTKDGDEEVDVPSLMELIKCFVLQARKWEGFFIGSGQTTDAETIPTKVAENASSRIVFFSSDRRARMSGLETDAIKTLLPLIRRAGSGVMVFDCSSWDGPVIGSIPLISVEDMLAYLGVTSVPRNFGETSEISEAERNPFGQGTETFHGNISEFRKPVSNGANRIPETTKDAILDLYREGCKRTEIQDKLSINGDEYWMVKAVCDEYDRVREG